jgi:hypothetical protein
MHHDHGYKLLFSHREFLIDLLGAFVPEPWVGELDFSTLEKVNNSYVTDDLRSREDDIVWRVRFGSRWLYVYILLEFQSSIDRYMAVRMLSYVGLLYQDLIRQGQITNDDPLPPVLPVVLYNGRKRWDAAEDIAHLIAELPPELRRYQPQLQYLLLDEGRYIEEGLPSLPKNLAAFLFRLESYRNTAAARREIRALIRWLNAPEQAELRRTIALWLTRYYFRIRMPGTFIPELQSLQEVENMLSENTRDWTKVWRQEGRQEGESAIILRQLERRFGVLDEAVRQRIHSADADTLLVWSDRVLTAQRLEEVFEDTPPV